MSTIFVSYRRGSTGGYAGRLVDRLRDAFPGVQVFMDIDTIQPGVDFVNVIEQTIASCDVMLALIGEDWATVTDKHGHRRLDDPNDFVRVEVGAALARNVPLIPVLVENATMPYPAELPADLARLARINAVEISDSRWDYDAGRLIESLKAGPLAPPATALMPVVPDDRGDQVAAAPLPAPTPTGQPSDRRTRRLVLIGLITLVAVIGTIAAIVASRRPADQTKAIAESGSDTTLDSSRTASGSSTTPSSTSPSTTKPITDAAPVFKAATADRATGTITLTFDQPVNLAAGSSTPLKLVVYLAQSNCGTPQGNGQSVVSGAGTATLKVKSSIGVVQPTTYIKLAEGFVVSIHSQTPNQPLGCTAVPTS